MEENKNPYNNSSLTFEEVMEILEAELYEIQNTYENPYKPLNFHDSYESYED